MPEEVSQSKHPDVRIDAAHAAATEETSEPDAPELQDDLAAEEVAEATQIRTQAAQLAGHLQTMQEDLDRREADLNARIARMENDMRSARFWLHERESELAERTEELDQRDQQVSDAENQLAEVLGGQHDFKSATVKLADQTVSIQQAIHKLRAQRHQQESDLHRQRQDIDRRRQASLALVQQLMKGVEQRRIAIENEYERRQLQLRLVQRKAFQDDYQKAAEEFEARQQYLDNAEALLVNCQADLEVQREQIRQQRERDEAELRDARTEVAHQGRRLDAEWNKRQEALARRSQQLDSREAALEQTRREVAAVHREALELRLATEELWAKLAGVMPAAALTAELAKIRRKLAESYCIERTAAHEKMQELEAKHTQLKDQYIKLTAEKKELHDWVTRRQAEIEQQAARLIARERELDKQEAESRAQSESWQNERRQYQEEIRRLLTDLRRGETAYEDADDKTLELVS